VIEFIAKNGEYVKWATADNRAYLAPCLQHSAQIQPNGWTSDTFGTLYEIAFIKMEVSNVK